MKIKITKELEVKHLSCLFEVEYWEDSKLDGQWDDNNEPKMPCIDKDEQWHLEINPENGHIENWPKGHTAYINYRVSDGCFISMATDEGLITYEGYAPKFLDTYGDGYENYLHFDIDENGFILDWDKDNLFDLTWEE